jgi:monoamine oxidase
VGHEHPLGALLDVAYAIEFGADTTDQSSLNLLYLLGYSRRRELQVFGESDERYRLRAGMGALPYAMAQALLWDETIEMGHWLESIRLASDGSYRLTFAVAGSGAREVSADVVILTLPFAVLRNLDYSGAGFDERKHLAIQELGRGRNGKLQLQFSLDPGASTGRYWNRTRTDARGSWVSSGSLYSDTGFQASWEPTRGYPGLPVLLKYTGGSKVGLLNQRHAYGNATSNRVRQDAAVFLSELEPLFPGVTAFWNGKAAGSLAHVEPRFACSYSYWRVGQYTSIAGYESVRQGGVYFAGEHCSLDYQGWMEGAARSGGDAARAVLSSLRGGGRR